MKTITEILNIVAFLLVVNYMTYVATKGNHVQLTDKVLEVSKGFKDVYGHGFTGNYVHNVHKLNALTVYAVKTFSVETVDGVVSLFDFNRTYMQNINHSIDSNLSFVASLLKR